MNQSEHKDYSRHFHWQNLWSIFKDPQTLYPGLFIGKDSQAY